LSSEKDEEYISLCSRSSNIDPGYADESHFVLISSKDEERRKALHGKGVFTEIHYLLVYSSFKPLFYWT